MPSYPQLSIAVRRRDGAAEVAPAGEIDLATSAQLERTIRSEAECAGDVLVDLGRVGFIDSAGLRSLIVLFQESKARGWRLSLRRGPARVQRVFEVTRAAEILPFA